MNPKWAACSHSVTTMPANATAFGKYTLTKYVGFVLDPPKWLTTWVPIGVKPRLATTDGVIALLLAPVSHNALVGTCEGGGIGGFLGSYAAVIETAVMIRSAKPEYLIVRA